MADIGALALRRARGQDADACAQIAREAYAMYVPRMATSPAPMLADYDLAIREHEVWVAVGDSDALVGFVVLIAAGDALLLDNIAVQPSAQGRGVGRALLDLAELRATEAGISRIELYTNVVMVENQQLYVARGYRETHRATVDGYERVCFAKQIAPTDTPQA